jgi:hypothetical protein
VSSKPTILTQYLHARERTFPWRKITVEATATVRGADECYLELRWLPKPESHHPIRETQQEAA